VDFDLTDQQVLMKKGIAEGTIANMPEEKIQQWYRNRAIEQSVTKSWVDADFGKLGLPEEFGGLQCDKLMPCMAIEDLCHGGGNMQAFGKGIKTFELVQEHVTEMQIKLTNSRNFLYRTRGEPADARLARNADRRRHDRDHGPHSRPGQTAPTLSCPPFRDRHMMTSWHATRTEMERFPCPSPRE
jgi:alkylation response protein AidB-like acyl-CoA dehydrogenase